MLLISIGTPVFIIQVPSIILIITGTDGFFFVVGTAVIRVAATVVSWMMIVGIFMMIRVSVTTLVMINIIGGNMRSRMVLGTVTLAVAFIGKR